MLRFLSRMTALLAGFIMASGAFGAATTTTIQPLAPPIGFEELERSHQTLVDIYYGDKKVGESLADVSPGRVRFLSPEKVLSFIPNVIASPDVRRMLATDLPTHPDLVCMRDNDADCGELSPDIVGVIFDEERFRVTLFFSPQTLKTVSSAQQVYLDRPNVGVSLTTALGFAISGSNGTSFYNLQNRTVLAVGRARIRSEISLASKLGFVVDDLVGEIDRNDFRVSAGLFSAPGLDLTGSRRIAGVGWATQFDTRADKDILRGTPIVLFLQRPSRVEMLVDGRLVTSAAYPAGNTVVDTSALPDGSYTLLLRIHEPSGAVRDEPRFFVKNAQVAPVGEPIYFGYAGMLANTYRHRPINLSKTFYYQVGTARRLNKFIAVDLSAVGAANKNMMEAGAWLMSRYARLRVAGLIATSGDRAVLMQLGSSAGTPFNFTFDLRRVWSSDGRPLIPLPSYVQNFGSLPPTGAQLGQGSYTQLSGAVGYNLGAAYLSVIGSLRKDRGFRPDYSVGPDISWPLISHNGLQLVVQANAQRTRTTTAAFIGFRMQLTSRHMSVLGMVGRAVRRDAESPSGNADRLVGTLNGEYSFETADRTQISASAGIDRNLESSDVHASGAVYSRLGSVHADILHSLGGGGLQYGMSMQSGAAVNIHDVAFGGRDISESAIVVSVEGERGSSSFDVLVNEQPRGRVSAGGSLPVFLQPYRAYKVRLRPVGSSLVDYDSGTREMTLYPGNVQHLRWRAQLLFTMFGRAVRPDGRPIVNSVVQSKRGVGETDQEGYFQVDVAQGDLLTLSQGTDFSCHVATAFVKPQNHYVALGEVVCR